MKVLYWQFLEKTGLKDNSKAKRLYNQYIESTDSLAVFIESVDKEEEETTSKKSSKKSKTDKIAMLDTDDSSDKDIDDADIVTK